MTKDTLTLYHALIAADREWTDCLKLSFGRYHLDARYDERGVSTPDLHRLWETKMVAQGALYAAQAAYQGAVA